jgi:hypothetical protein
MSKLLTPEERMERLRKRLRLPTQAKTPAVEATTTTKRARLRRPAPPAPVSPRVTIEKYVAEREAEEIRKAAESEVFTSLVKALVNEREYLDDFLEDRGLIERQALCETCGVWFYVHDGHKCDGAIP